MKRTITLLTSAVVSCCMGTPVLSCDEVRFWNCARTAAEIGKYRTHRP
ncbi:MAG: hypothetical protein IJ658_07275 [Kiritimatiellae bacterium]|nr:hypothetical protein [Kiritimatiellia bacterium]